MPLWLAGKIASRRVREHLCPSGWSECGRGAKHQPGLLMLLPVEKPSHKINLQSSLNLTLHLIALQAPNANALQRLAGRGARSVQVVGGAAGDGRLENRLELLPGLRVRACAACAPQGRMRTQVAIDDVFLELLGLRCGARPLPCGKLRWLRGVPRHLLPMSTALELVGLRRRARRRVPSVAWPLRHECSWATRHSCGQLRA